MELKQPTTFDEQISSLKEKNITIDDYDKCCDFLRKTNYYRLSAYYLPFKGPDGRCAKNISFSQIKAIYEFDQKLRSLLFDAIEDVEIYLRTQLAYYHSHKYGADGYMRPSVYNERHNHVLFTSHIASCITENEKTPVVKHHMSKYEGKFPLWVIVEFFSIGMLSHFYRGFKTSDKKEVSKNMYGVNYKNLESWLRCLTDLRNKCAHYSRLYFAIFTATPKIPNEVDHEPTRKLFSQIYMLKMLYPGTEHWNNRFMLELSALIEEYGDSIYLNHMDFPSNWYEILRK